MKDAVNPQLWDQGADSHRGMSCPHKTATLYIILEQSSEWNSPLYVNFTDYEKAFDSLDQQRLLKHYGVPQKITSIIRNFYSEMICTVVCGRQLRDIFHVKTGVRQGHLLSPFLFLLASDWMLVGPNLMTCTLQMTWLSSPIPIDRCKRQLAQLQMMHFTDDLALLSHTHRQMQETTSTVADDSACLGLKVNGSKSKVLKNNAAVNTNPKHWKEMN